MPANPPMRRLAQILVVLAIMLAVLGLILYSTTDQAWAAFQHEGDFSVFVLPALKETQTAADFEEAAQAWGTRGNSPARWAEFEDDTAAVERSFRAWYWQIDRRDQEPGRTLGLAR
jgi:hypothetical protein